jgi:hypothetical protein
VLAALINMVGLLASMEMSDDRAADAKLSAALAWCRGDRVPAMCGVAWGESRSENPAARPLANVAEFR